MKRFSITDKLIIASLMLSIITITLVASYSFTNAKTAILDRTFNQLTSVKVIKASLLDRFFNNCIREVQIAKASSDIVEITKEINQFANQNPLLAEDIKNDHNAFLREIQEAFYHRIFIVGLNQQIYPLRNSGDFNYDQKDLEQHYGHLFDSKVLCIKDYSRIKDSIMVLSICSPIVDTRNTIIGHIVFEVNSLSIDSIMLEYNPAHGLGTSGESYLVGSDYLMRSSSRFQQNSILSTKVHTKAVSTALNGEESTDILVDYRGIKVLSSYMKLQLPQLDWVIVSEIDYEEATIPIYRIRNEIIFFSIFIFFLVLGVTYILSQRITIPIQRLNEAAREVGAGNLDVAIPSKLSDEIGELTTSFNQMAQELKVERRKSLGSLIDGQDFERQRLSRELHDGLGQSLIGLKLKYENCIHNSGIKEPDSHKFNDLSFLIDRTIEETRRISNNLMPAALKEFGLFSAMRHLCNEIANHTAIKINFHPQGTDKHIPDKIKTYVFRITQESISNIIKHSRANSAIIKIAVNDDGIILEINDDGIGYDEKKVNKGKSNGLNNLKDRVKLLNGRLQVNTSESKGTHIQIEIPLKPKQNG